MNMKDIRKKVSDASQIVEDLSHNQHFLISLVIALYHITAFQ